MNKSGSSTLNTGITLPTFSLSGDIPLEKDKLIIFLRASETSSKVFLIMYIEMSSYPGVFPDFMDTQISLSSSKSSTSKPETHRFDHSRKGGKKCSPEVFRCKFRSYVSKIITEPIYYFSRIGNNAAIGSKRRTKRWSTFTLVDNFIDQF